MLLTLTQLQGFKSICSNIDQAKSLEPYIKEAQMFDLRPFLGDALYADLLADYEASPSLQKYDALYTGGSYSHAGYTYENPGLVPVLAYYTYARYVANANSISTRTGIMVKKNDFSDPASDKTIARLVDQARSGARSYLDQVELFMIRNSKDYPLWRAITQRKSKMRISGVGGNSTDRLGGGRCTRCGMLLERCSCAIYTNQFIV